MTNFMQHASRLAMIAVLGAAPLAASAQDDATKPAQDEPAAEAQMDDSAADSSTDADANADVDGDAAEGEVEVETEMGVSTDGAETPDADAPAMDDNATAPATTEPMTDDAAMTDAEEEPAKPVEGQIVMQSENTILADDLIGSDIYSDAGEKIGEVDDLIVTLDGKIDGVVIGVGGFLGIGEKWVAVKMDTLSTMTDESDTLRLVSSATKADLEAAEEFRTAEDMEAEQQSMDNAAPADPAATPADPAAEPADPTMAPAEESEAPADADMTSEEPEEEMEEEMEEDAEGTKPVPTE